MGRQIVYSMQWREGPPGFDMGGADELDPVGRLQHGELNAPVSAALRRGSGCSAMCCASQALRP
jgi:hypothetical protein